MGSKQILMANFVKNYEFFSKNLKLKYRKSILRRFDDFFKNHLILLIKCNNISITSYIIVI